MKTTSTRRRVAAATLVALAAGAFTAAAAPPPRVANIRQLAVSPYPPGARIEIALDRAVAPEIASTASGIALELDATRPGYGIHGSVFSDGLVAEIRLASIGVPSRPRMRIDVRARGAVSHRVRADGVLLVVELVPEGVPWPSAPAADPAPPEAAPAPPARATVAEALEESDLDGESPTPDAPTLASELVAPLAARRDAPSLAFVEPAPPAGAPPRLRELVPIAADPVPELALPEPSPALPELVSESVPARAPRLRAIVEIPSEPISPLPPPATPMPAAMAPEDADGAAPPALRVEVTPSREAPEPLPAPTIPAPEAAPGPALPDELARPDELVPPAELPRPIPRPAPPIASGPATRVLALERLAPGVVRIAADGVLGFLTFRLENPERFVLELAGVVNQSPLDSLEIGEEILVGVRIAQYRPAPRPVTRVVFDLRAPSVPEIESTVRGIVVRFVRVAPRAVVEPPGPRATPAVPFDPR